MQLETFIIIGENIHCTRTLKRDGNMVDAAAGTIRYDSGGAQKAFPIPEHMLKSAEWQGGN